MSIGLKGNVDGSGAVQIGGSDAITISTGLNTTFAGTVTATGTVAGSTGTLYPLTSGTAIASTSSTAIDFTSIPSWVKRITVMFSGVSTSGTSPIMVQIGSGSYQTSGYAGCAGNRSAETVFSAGFLATNTSFAANTYHGSMAISLLGSNVWSEMSVVSPQVANGMFGSGSVTLSGTLDRVRITTVNGTDTFDAGTINILYE